jgi:hypothetical protein
MSGQRVGINAGYKWSVSDGLGAGVSGTAGVLNLGGREIGVNTMPPVSQVTGSISYGLTWALGIANGSIAMRSYSDKTKARNAMIASFVSDWAQFAASLGFLGAKIWIVRPEKIGALEGAQNRSFDASEEAFKLTDEDMKRIAQNEKIVDALVKKRESYLAGASMPAQLYLLATYFPLYEKLALGLEMILDITKTVYQEIETWCKWKGDKLDQLNFSALIIDNALINSVTLGMMVSALTGESALNGAAGLSLGYDGSVTLKASKDQKFYAITQSEAAAPVPLTTGWITHGVVTSSALGAAEKLAGNIRESIKLTDNLKDLDTKEEL